MSDEQRAKSIEEPVFQDLSVYDIMMGPRYEPHERITLFSSDDYEKFTQSWLFACKKNKYDNLVDYGGSGDKGRDVVGYYEDNTWDNYQCKKHSNALSPSIIKLEVGKLIYYTFNGDYSVPTNYYFVSPKGVSSNSRDLLVNPILLRDTMISDWVDVCSTAITSTKVIPLTDELKQHINNFDFSIFSYVDSDQMVNELYGTKFYARFFGGGFSMPRKDDGIEPPEEVQDNERKYIECLLEAYGDHHKVKFEVLEDLAQYSKELGHLKKQRQFYYTAEALRKYSLESLLPQPPSEKTHFEKLKDEYCSFLEDVIEEEYDDGYQRLKRVLIEVQKVSCDNNILKSEVGFNDKKGICHHLSNDGRIKWVSNDE